MEWVSRLTYYFPSFCEHKLSTLDNDLVKQLRQATVIKAKVIAVGVGARGLASDWA